MTDTAIGFALIGIAIVVVLGVVFVVASRGGSGGERPTPPLGVHLPPPSFLPVLFSGAAALLGAGLAFRADDQLANPWLAVPGLLLLVITAVSWVRAAGREWRDVEHSSHDDGAAH
ncbi:MAG: hypothetical protein H0U86_17500 [Chloroflexi bacterium]|nr:hypothetical protein [Chloroflexota bacterium]